MNPPKCTEMDYINFLVAAQRVFSSIAAAKSHPAEDSAPAHDAYTRLLQRLPPDSRALWEEVKPLIGLDEGVLVLDDTTLDKPYAREMALVTRHWSGKHGRVVRGINLISLVWTHSSCRLPCDFRLYNKEHDGLSKVDYAWQVEVYHRTLKQFTGIEQGQYRLEVSQRNHIALALRAFVRLEVHRLQTGISCFEAKASIIRLALRPSLAHRYAAMGGGRDDAETTVHAAHRAGLRPEVHHATLPGSLTAPCCARTLFQSRQPPSWARVSAPLPLVQLGSLQDLSAVTRTDSPLLRITCARDRLLVLTRARNTATISSYFYDIVEARQ